MNPRFARIVFRQRLFNLLDAAAFLLAVSGTVLAYSALI